MIKETSNIIPLDESDKLLNLMKALSRELKNSNATNFITECKNSNAVTFHQEHLEPINFLSESFLTKLKNVNNSIADRYLNFINNLKTEENLIDADESKEQKILKENFRQRKSLIELSFFNKNTYDKKTDLFYEILQILQSINIDLENNSSTALSNNITHIYSTDDIIKHKNSNVIAFTQQTSELIDSLPASLNIEFASNKNADFSELYNIFFKKNTKEFEENSNVPNIHKLVSDCINILQENLLSSESNQEFIFSCLIDLVKASSKLNKRKYPLKYPSQEIKESLHKIIEFLKKKNKLLNSKLSKIHIVKELLSIMLFPQILDQCDRNLCGVDIFLRELSEKSPLRFVLLGINLAENGNSNIPFFIECPPNMENESSIILVMTASIRHSSNLPFIGYHPNSSIEYFRGATLPRDLFVWFKKSGFEVLLDGIKIFDENYQEISMIHRFFVGGIYSEQHIDISKADTIDRLISDINNKTLGIDGLFSVAFTKLTRAVIDMHDEKMAEKQILLGAQYGHFMKITDFSENADNTINISLNTYGQKFTVNYLPKHIFNQHCFGIFITEFKYPLQLNNQYQKENSQESGCFPLFSFH